MFAAALYTNRLHFDTVVAQSPLQVMNHVLHSFKRGTSRQSPSKNLLFFIYNGKSESHCLTQTPWFHVPMFADTLNVWSAGIQTHGSWDIRWEYMCSLSKTNGEKSLWSLSSLGMLLAIAYFPLLCHWWYFKAFKGEEKVGGELLLDDAS